LNLFRTPSFLSKLFPTLLWRVPVEEKILYLTFDDGPIPGPTEFVIEELKKRKARATFFCIGDNVRKHPAVFQKVLAEGHTIGNHTFNHLKGWSTSLEKYLDNIALCESQFTTHTPGDLKAQHTRLFRPPYGRITNPQIRALRDRYQIVMWDVLTHDYSKSISPEKCLSGTMKAARSGSIVVFHDSLKAERNLTYVLPRFLDHYASRGFMFDSLSET
jgi:peptidoglycan/xylan/chitin deacetylase (PgdA/CDA1 family)